jgi:RNA polymerase sigma-70 factor (ECF subfamily)
MNPPERPPTYHLMRAPGIVPAAPGDALGGDADALLVGRMAQGDEQALGALYDRWYDVVAGLVQRIVREADDVDDVIEEAFWQAWRQADRFESSRGSVQTWLLTIARSRSLDRVRTVQRRREDPIETGEGVADRQLTAPGDPGNDAEHAERRTIVVGAMNALPIEQREVIELGYFGGFSQTEIADRIGVPLGTVKTRMRLALRKLRSHLDLLREDAR